ncbi:MAG: ISAs1 family transposase [Fibromonadaceae bacterium]|jgi:predicted transposase YbfD/YdcC|nr:ISAs1 family transposase [Fibromonadaceae bacterium]
MRIKIEEYFEEVATENNYNGYFYSVSEAITIAILGTFCGLRNMKQIQRWASDERIRKFLSKEFGIYEVPCYSWFTQILGMINPKSFSECFTKWVINTNQVTGKTISFDGKTVCSTAKMAAFKNPLHIVSAQIAELGITLAQQSVDEKSNEIPVVQKLLKLLETEGCVIVADAMHCQKETAKAIIAGKADYLLSVKDNQPTLKADIEDYIQDTALRKSMKKSVKTEKNRDRIEKRTAFVTNDISWLFGKDEWASLACIGAINTQFETKNGKSDEWHYFISSRDLNAEDLLLHARLEWSVETMHWLLDVHFGEDFCRAAEQNTQENLNIIRKIVLNSMRSFKNSTGSKAAFSHFMLDCMIEPKRILRFLKSN